MGVYKILIVSKSFYPQNTPRSNRATELAKSFSRMGHQVTVLTPRVPDHEQFEKEAGIIIKQLGRLRWKPIDLKGSLVPYLFRRFAKRFLNLFFQYPDLELVQLVKKTLTNERGYDLLISVAVPYPIHWGVAAASGANNRIARVWIADCGDPFMGQENDSFRYPFYFKYVEKWFCKKADFITVPTQGAVNGYYPEFRHKIRVIPQGFDFSQPIRSSQPITVERRPAFAYGGIFIPKRRDPSEFLSYLIESDVDFEFHVYTPTRGLVEPFIKRDKKRRIKLHDLVPRQDFLGRLAGMDFVVNFENVGSKQTPSKLIDYVIAGKPVLSVKTGALITENIDEFLNGNYESQFVVENPDQYRIENVSAQFLSLLSEPLPCGR